MQIINFIFSIVTAITAIIAIIISAVQIHSSNKQSLFNRRLKIFLTVKWMASLIESNMKLLKNYIKELKAGPTGTLNVLFFYLTNTSFLEPCQAVVCNVLKNNEQRIFLLKMEELKCMAEETLLVFPKNTSSDIADFIFYYHELLMHVYSYLVLMQELQTQCRESKNNFPTSNVQENSKRKMILRDIVGVVELFERNLKFNSLRKIKQKIKL